MRRRFSIRPVTAGIDPKPRLCINSSSSTIRYFVNCVGAALKSGLENPSDADIQAVLKCQRPPFAELLRSDRPPPAGYKQLSAAQTENGGVYARVFEIEH